MRANYQRIPHLYKFLLLLLFAIAPMSYGNDGAQSADQPHSFNSVRLSPGGFIGIDSLGNRWRYDFERAIYVPFEPGDQEDVPFEFLEGRVPIEERAIEEKRVAALEENVIIGPDEYVTKDIIAYGRITVRGWAKGNVQSIGGRVLITETGQVDGNVIAPEVVVKEGGSVRGKIQETGVSIDLTGVRGAFDFGGIIIVFIFTISLMIACFIITALPSRHVGVIGRCMAEYRWRSLTWGWVSLFLLPIVVVLLILTLVGILAIPLVPLAIVYIFFVSITIFARRIGEGTLRRFLRISNPGVHLSTQLGVLLYMSFWLITAILLGAADDVSQGFGVLFLVLSILLSSYILLTGLGAALLSRGGTREYYIFYAWKRYGDQSDAPSPAPPPIPDSQN